MDGISHLTFLVRDLEPMTRLLCDGLGAKLVYDSSDEHFSLSRERFFLLAGVWIAIMEGEPPAQRSYQHVAFAIGEDELPAYQARLEAIGVELLPSRNRISGEGQSLYFHDFDNHLFELHTGTLVQRLAAYADRRSWSQPRSAGLSNRENAMSDVDN